MKKIIEENGTYRYFDKNGTELHEGDMIRYDSGREYKLYRTAQGKLGTDATNPLWLKDGRAYECEYGVYPLTWDEMGEIERVRG